MLINNIKISLKHINGKKDIIMKKKQLKLNLV